MNYNFIKISDIENIAENASVDIIGICKTATDCTSLTSKAGRELQKRELEIIDDTGR